MSEVVTLANLKEYLGITDISYDTVLQDIIDATESQLKSRYGIAFDDTIVSGAILDYRKEIDNYTLYINKKPISSISSLEINEAGPDSTPSWKTLTIRTDTVSGDVYLDSEEGSLFFIDPDLGYDDLQNVRISYTYGWAAGTVPQEVYQIILMMSAQGALSGRMGINLYTSQDSVRIGELAVTKGGGALETAQRTLQIEIDKLINSLDWITPEGAVMV